LLIEEISCLVEAEGRPLQPLNPGQEGFVKLRVCLPIRRAITLPGAATTARLPTRGMLGGNLSHQAEIELLIGVHSAAATYKLALPSICSCSLLVASIRTNGEVARIRDAMRRHQALGARPARTHSNASLLLARNAINAEVGSLLERRRRCR